MSEPTITELERTLRILNDAAATGKDFVWEQAPLVAREVVYWETSQWFLATAFWLATLVVVVFIVRWLHGHGKRLWKVETHDSEYYTTIGAGYCLAAFAVFMLLARVSYCTVQFTKGIVAPRLVIIDYVTDRVKP